MFLFLYYLFYEMQANGPRTWVNVIEPNAIEHVHIVLKNVHKVQGAASFRATMNNVAVVLQIENSKYSMYA